MFWEEAIILKGVGHRGGELFLDHEGIVAQCTGDHASDNRNQHVLTCFSGTIMQEARRKIWIVSLESAIQFVCSKLTRLNKV